MESITSKPIFHQALDRGAALGNEASLEPDDRTVLSQLSSELTQLRREVAELRPKSSVAEVQLLRPPDGSIGPNGGFSPHGAAYALPAYLGASVYQGLNVAHAMGTGCTLQAALHCGMLTSAQRSATECLSSIGQNEQLGAALPVLGGLASGMLLLKGIHGLCSAQMMGSASGQVLGGLDVATSLATLVSVLPGYQVLGGATAMGLLAVRAVASSVATDVPR